MGIYMGKRTGYGNILVIPVLIHVVILTTSNIYQAYITSFLDIYSQLFTIRSHFLNGPTFIAFLDDLPKPWGILGHGKRFTLNLKIVFARTVLRSWSMTINSDEMRGLHSNKGCLESMFFVFV